MYGPSSSDRGLETSVARHDHTGAWRRREDRERGQAMVEFALILFPLLILVAGIIQFGIGLNYWLDMQRIANQGARWAAVNNWPPDCPRGSASCTNNLPANCQVASQPSRARLQEVLRCAALTRGLRQSVTVRVCYPAGVVKTGDPVRVELRSPFTFVPILNIGTVGLAAKATMRQELTNPNLITGAAAC